MITGGFFIFLIDTMTNTIAVGSGLYGKNILYRIMGRLITIALLALLLSLDCSAQQPSILFFRKDPTVPALYWSRMGIFNNGKKVASIRRNNIAFYHPNQPQVTIDAKLLTPSLFSRYAKSDSYDINADDKITFVEVRVKYRLVSGVKIKFIRFTPEQFKTEYTRRKKLRKKLAKAHFPTINSLYGN